MIDKILEQRISLKFLAKLKKTPIESYKLLKDVYGESVPTKECVFEWHKRFSEGREDIHDDTRPDQSTTSKSRENVERVRQLVRFNRRITTRTLADRLGLNKETVRRILTIDLRMRKIVPRSISGGAKANVNRVDWRGKGTIEPNEDRLGSKADGELSESSEVGEWDDTEQVEAAAAEHPAPREEDAVHTVVIKQEVMDEEVEDDYMMGPAADENGEFEEPPWDNPSAVRMEYHPHNQQLASKAAEADGELSEGSEVGEWDDTENGEAASESVDHSAPREENAVHAVMVKQEVMDDEVEDDYMMDQAADENGEFEETEEPPWDKSPSLEDIPAAAEMEEDTASNQVESGETDQTGPSDSAEPQNLHVCKYCSQSFAKRHQLYGHLATHSRKGHHHSKASASRIRSAPQYNRPPAKTRAWLLAQQSRMKFNCIDCNQNFVGVITYTSHKGNHRQKDKKFHCSVCNHIYPRAVDLIFHEWTYHTGDRPFPCDKCPSAFARQTSWTYHILAHIGNSSRSPSRNLRDVSSNQPSPKKVDNSPKGEVVSRRTMAPRKAALEGRAAAQMGAVVASVGTFPFKCRTCGKGILNEETWEYHLVIHPDGGETRQNLPPKDLESLRAQLRQTIICESKTKLACLQCGLEYVGLQGLANHKSEQHLSAGGYRCSVCYKGVENVHKFIRHEMSHTKVKIYVCETCGREMADRMSFVRHIIAHFNENQFEVPPGGNSISQAKVADSEEAMDVKENNFDLVVEKLLSPIQESLKQVLAPCLQCGQVFEGVQRLITHKDTHSNSSAGSHAHACWICAQAFESANALVEHEWKHTDTKPYGCDKCDQKFSAKDDWMNHLHTHIPAATANASKAVPQPSGSLYGKRQRAPSSDPSSPATPTKVASTSQSPTTVALRPYACGQCKSIFSDVDALEAHAVQSHGLVHPFKCKICGKGYRLLLRLMHHESSVHPQLMGHPCEYCDKSFSDASHLKLHCHLIHGDGPYMCDVCGKRFRMVGHLKIHRNMHISGKDKRGKGSPFVGQATTSSVDELEYSEFDVFD